MKVAASVLCLVLVVSAILAGSVGAPLAESDQPDWLFGTKQSFDMAAGMVRIVADEATSCKLQVDLTDAQTITSTFMILLEDADGPIGWFFGSTTIFPAHARLMNLLNSEDVVGELFQSDDSSTSAFRYRIEHSFSGEITLLAIGHDLTTSPATAGATENGPAHQHWPAFHEYSMAFSGSCDRSVNVKAHGDAAPVFISTYRGESGVAISSTGSGGQLAEHAGGRYAAPEVSLRSMVLGDQLVTIRLDHPEGQREWMHAPGDGNSLVRHDGGPGDYSLWVNRLHITFWGMWSGVMLFGFYPVESLDEIADLPHPGRLAYLPVPLPTGWYDFRG